MRFQMDECGIGGGNNNNRRCNVAVATNVICIVHALHRCRLYQPLASLVFPNIIFYSIKRSHRTLFTVRHWQHKSVV